MGVRPLGGLTLVLGTSPERVMDADPLDHEDPVLEVDVALGL